MSAVALERPVPFSSGPRAADAAAPLPEPVPAANGDIEPWELTSELVLVCPEVRRRSRELLPQRDPNAFLARARQPIVQAASAEKRQPAFGLPTVAIAYTLLRLAELAVWGFALVGALVALALFADAVH
jgi:hypothetical protein